MNILVIGGTQFVGRAVVEEALARGFGVTLLNRGQTNARLFQGEPRVERLLGDRKSDLSALAQGEWDAVVDCVGYTPGPVRALANLLSGRVKMYAFVSSISVYAPSTGDFDETSPLLEMPEDASVDEYAPENYGALKALCEREAQQVFGDNALIVRAGLQIGANDHTDRFSDWVERIAKRSRVLVPGGAPMPWQQIDARDTAGFLLSCLERGLGGIYNITGHAAPMRERLEEVRKVVHPACDFAEASEAWLEEHKVEPWAELALWLPEKDRGGFPLAVSIDRALTAGMVLTPFEKTVADIRDRVMALPADRPRRGGLPSAKEDELLSLLS